jgi:hypothetical protein
MPILTRIMDNRLGSSLVFVRSGMIHAEPGSFNQGKWAFIFCYYPVNKMNCESLRFPYKLISFIVNKIQLLRSKQKTHHGHTNR